MTQPKVLNLDAFIVEPARIVFDDGREIVFRDFRTDEAIAMIAQQQIISGLPAEAQIIAQVEGMATLVADKDSKALLEELPAPEVPLMWNWLKRMDKPSYDVSSEPWGHVTWQGAEHAITPVTVAMYRAGLALDERKNPGAQAIFDAHIETLHAQIPTLSCDDLRDMPSVIRQRVEDYIIECVQAWVRQRMQELRDEQGNSKASRRKTS